MRWVLFNADDFGLSDAVDEGILEAMTRGHVQATSAMVCDADCRRRVARQARRIHGRVGLHLQLTDSRPISDPARLPTLVDAEGRFPRRRESIGRLDTEEVLREWRAQLKTIRGLGIEPAHLDSHHHVHGLPGAREAYVQLAAESGLRARGLYPWVIYKLQSAGVACADCCESPWLGPAATVEQLTASLTAVAARARRGAIVEVACHPARVDAELERRSSYARPREEELAILCDPALPGLLAEAGFRLAPLMRFRRPTLRAPKG